MTKNIIKKTLFTCLLFLSTVGFSDTLDFWSVYLNDSLIAQFNEASSNKEITLNRSLINKTDSITIVYGNDHPCSNCEYYYSVNDMENEIKLLLERRNIILSNVSFPLYDLKLCTRLDEFGFSVFENDYNDKHDFYTHLFNLKLE